MRDKDKKEYELYKGVEHYINQKYYTPSLEEFYIGFECEFCNNMQTNKFENTVCDVDLMQIVMDNYEHEEYKGEFANTFRVKHLDKEDIESFGFVKENIKHPTVEIFKSGLKNQRGDKVGLLYSYKSKWCLIFAGEFDVTIWEDKKDVFRTAGNLFAGFLNNKSELKRLMKQLDIN